MACVGILQGPVAASLLLLLLLLRLLLVVMARQLPLLLVLLVHVLLLLVGVHGCRRMASGPKCVLQGLPVGLCCCHGLLSPPATGSIPGDACHLHQDTQGRSGQEVCALGHTALLRWQGG